MFKFEKDIILSVIMISYNHEKYIKQALESVLKQNICYAYEILIADDASTDNTIEIICQMQKKYPNKIKLFKYQNNRGASLNLYDLLMNAKGKYITFLEGDDYWEITPELQKSIDFLEMNTNYIGISRSTKTFSERENKIISVSKYPKLKNNTATYSTWRKCKPIGSPIFRNFYQYEKKTDFSIIYKSARMVAENALGFLLIIRGNIYVTDIPWEIKRGDRVDNAKNYNTIYSQYEIAKELVASWNCIEEFYPQYDYRLRRKSALIALFDACKQQSNIEDYRKQMKRYKFSYRIYICAIAYSLYLPRFVRTNIMSLGCKVYHMIFRK